MINTDINNFKKNIGSILEQTIKYNQHVSITTESGNAVIICKPTTPPL